MTYASPAEGVALKAELTVTIASPVDDTEYPLIVLVWSLMVTMFVKYESALGRGVLPGSQHVTVPIENVVVLQAVEQLTVPLSTT